MILYLNCSNILDLQFTLQHVYFMHHSQSGVKGKKRAVLHNLVWCVIEHGLD